MPLPILRLTVAFRFRRFAQLVGLALLLAAAPAFAESEDDTQKASVLLAEAYEHLTAGEAATAIEKLETAHRLADEESVDILLLLAIAENQVGEAKDAIDHAEEALDLDPEPALAADAYFQVGLGWLQRAAPDDGGRWSGRDLRRAEEALREAVRLEGPRVLEAKAHLGYVLVLREMKETEPDYEEGFALVRERYEDGSPGSGMNVARRVLCGSPDCEPVPILSLEDFAKLSDERPRFLQIVVDENTEGVVLKPEPLAPIFPPGHTLARRWGVRGEMVVQAIIDKEGRVAGVRVVKGLPFGMNEIVVDEIERWRFEPATLDGDPVPVYYNWIFNYR